MTHFTTPEFWESFNQLPGQVQRKAKSNFELLKVDPAHKSLRYKKVGRFRSVRAGLRFRALGVEDGGDVI